MITKFTKYLLLVSAIAIFTFMIYDLNTSIKNKPFLGISDKTLDSVISKIPVSSYLNYILASPKGSLNPLIQFNDTNAFDTSYINILLDTLLKFKLTNDQFFDIDLICRDTDTNFKDLITKFAISRLSEVNANILIVNPDTLLFLDTSAIFKFISVFNDLSKSFFEKNIFLVVNFYKDFIKINSKVLKSFIDSQKIIFTTNQLMAKYLRDSLNFNGIIIQKIDKSLKINTYSDIYLIDSLNDSILNQIKNKNFISQKVLLRKLRKIIALKIWLQNHKSECEFSVSKITKIQFITKFYQKNIFILKDTDNLLPIKNIRKPTIVYLFERKGIPRNLLKELKFYKNFQIKKVLKSDDIKLTANYEILAIFFNQITDTSIINKLKKIDKKNNLVIVNFCYKNLSVFSNFKHLIFSKYHNLLTEQYVIDAIYGGLSIKNKLPLWLKKFGKSKFTEKTRLRTGIAEEVNLRSDILKRIDSIVFDAIRKGVFPSCQIVIAKNGVVIWDKAYGFHTYQRKIKTTTTDLYDIASITKIMATTLATMKLYEMHKISLDDKLEKYFKNTTIHYKRLKQDTTIYYDTINPKNYTLIELQKMIKDKDTIHLSDTQYVIIDTVIYQKKPTQNIFKVTVRQLLQHKSGIQPAMPILRFIQLRKFYNQLIAWKVIDTHKVSFQNFYEFVYSKQYIKDSAEIEVAKNMFLTKNFYDTLLDDLRQLPVSTKKRYIYSDVNMILLKITIDTILKDKFIKFLNQQFYKPLGLRYITYKPLKKFSKNKIIPTAEDKYWRRQLLLGYVHDPSAALLGGIAGNAGLFSNAMDLAIISQMLLNKGTYGGIRFLKKSTVDTFTTRQKNHFRGLGFDMQRKKQIIASSAPKSTFGHLGFTGACVWIDPENQIIFVFLSNRIHPSEKNWKINKYKIRQKIHQVIYDSISD